MRRSYSLILRIHLLCVIAYFVSVAHAEQPQILFARLYKATRALAPKLSTFVYGDDQKLAINFEPAINQVIELKRDAKTLELFVSGVTLGDAIKADLPYFGSASQSLYDFIIFNIQNGGVLIKLSHSPNNNMLYAITDAGIIISAEG